ncbi:MAG: metallophosphoesterase family protein [Paludibacteraceae bacterium]|nr:metallophosphoesterase family protein [Paludibacteraceae bacterium]
MKMQNKTIVKLIVCSVALLTAVIVCITRWSAWFGNLPEPAYNTPPQPHNIIMTYGADATKDRTISWRADTVEQDFALMLEMPDKTKLEFEPTDSLVVTRNGKGVYYRVELHNLKKGKYHYQIIGDKYESRWYDFEIQNSNNLSFIVFGDVQDEVGGPSKQMFSMVDSLHHNVNFWAFVGDIIERPMDVYWQYWFECMNDVQTHKPIIAATGNHEHLKGLKKTRDNRWTNIFGNPHNGPERFAGTTYYVDFQNMRFIVIDTDGLTLFSDYTRTSAWLRKIADNDKRWNILMLHHPIYSTCQGRDNTLLNIIFRHSLKHIDIVLEGHDHSYAKRFSRTDTTLTTPVYIETTSAQKYYLSKVSPDDDRILSGHPVYNCIDIMNNTLIFRTYMIEGNTLYDQFTIEKTDSSLNIINQEPDTPEIIDLPDKYKGKNNIKIRRFNNRKAAREKNVKGEK